MCHLKWILLIGLLALWTGCDKDRPRRGPDGPIDLGGALQTLRRGHVMTTIGGDMVLVMGGESLCVRSVGRAELVTGSPDGSLVAFSTDSAAYTLPTSLPDPNKVADGKVTSIDVSGKNQTAVAVGGSLLLIASDGTLVDVTNGVGEVRDVLWVEDGSRAVFTWNRDNPNHFEPWSVDADGADLRKLGSTQTDPATPSKADLLASPTANEILLLLDAADGTQQIFFGPADGSAPLEQLSPAPGETGSADPDVKVSRDGSAAHFRSDGALYAADLDTGETERVSADGPGAVTRFEPTTAASVVYVKDALVLGGGQDQPLIEFDGEVLAMRVVALGLPGGLRTFVACHVRPPAGADDTLHVAAVDGSSSDEFDITGRIMAMLWDEDEDELEVITRDPALGRDVFGKYDVTTGELSQEYLLGLDRNVDAEYDVVGDSIVRIESIGSGTTLASVVTEAGVTPVCLGYGSAIPLPEFSFDPAAETCNHRLVPAMTFTAVGDPTDFYVRHGLLSRRRGGQFILRDFDTGRVFANRARAVSDITATPLEFEGLDPSFQHFYNYPQGVQTLGSDIILTFDEGLYTDPFGQRTVTQPAPRTFPILVAVGPGGTFHELTDYMDLEDIFFGPFGRIFPK